MTTIRTGLDAFDRLLGGGLNPGDSAILTCANPDIARAAAYTIATNAGIDYGHGAHKVALIAGGDSTADVRRALLANIARVPVANLDDRARWAKVERADGALDRADLHYFGQTIPDLDTLRARLPIDGAADLIIVNGYQHHDAARIVNDAAANVYGAVLFIIDAAPTHQLAPIHAGIYKDQIARCLYARGPLYAVDLYAHPRGMIGRVDAPLIHLPAYGRIENTARGV